VRIFGKDSRLQRPDTFALGSLGQRCQKSLPYLVATSTLRDIHAHLSHASIHTARGNRTQSRPAQNLISQAPPVCIFRDGLSPICPIQEPISQRWRCQWRCLRDKWRALRSSRRRSWGRWKSQALPGHSCSNSTFRCGPNSNPEHWPKIQNPVTRDGAVRMDETKLWRLRLPVRWLQNVRNCLCQ
jgi:hypothetical protein